VELDIVQLHDDQAVRCHMEPSYRVLVEVVLKVDLKRRSCLVLKQLQASVDTA
jgi:hypothetical protein